MSTLEKLKNYKESCEQFFLKFTKDLAIKMPLEQFHKLRLYFINILCEVSISLSNNNVSRVFRNFSNLPQKHIWLSMFCKSPSPYGTK